MKKELKNQLIKLGVLYVIGAVCISILLFSCTAVKSHHTSRHFKVDACPRWADNIKNPENEEFVEEVAFNLNKPVSQVTQKEFNNRYLNN